jgi:hypothetical protein
MMSDSKTQPTVGTTYFIPGYFKGVDKVIWKGDMVDAALWKKGWVFLDQEKALTKAKDIYNKNGKICFS